MSSRLDAADAVGHHHSGIGAAALGPIDPSFDRVTRRRRNLYGDALSGGVVRDRHGHRLPIILGPSDSVLRSMVRKWVSITKAVNAGKTLADLRGSRLATAFIAPLKHS